MAHPRLFCKEEILLIKTINVGNKEVRLSNNIGWTIIYRDQFGHDIVSSLTPVMASMMDLVSGFLSEFKQGEEINAYDVLKNVDGDVLMDAVVHLSGVELVDIINIIWAMAKAADDSIAEPRIWIQQFDEFPLDVIVPEAVKLAFNCMVSRKNLQRLTSLFGSRKSQP